LRGRLSLVDDDRLGDLEDRVVKSMVALRSSRTVTPKRPHHRRCWPSRRRCRPKRRS
jgi:hypothetical protein